MDRKEQLQQRLESLEKEIEDIKNEINEPEYASFDEYGGMEILAPFKGEIRSSCQVGRDAVPLNLQGKCLILNTRQFDWEIIDNPSEDSIFTKLLVAKKK